MQEGETFYKFSNVWPASIYWDFFFCTMELKSERVRLQYNWGKKRCVGFVYIEFSREEFLCVEAKGGLECI